MSLQLALYPQSINGYSSIATPNQDEMIADNVLFQTVPDDSPEYTIDSDPPNDALNQDPANGNWKRFSTNVGNGWTYTPAPNLFSNTKTQSGTNTRTGVAFFGTNGGTNSSGIYQKIYGLKPLQSYDLTINKTTNNAGAGFFVLGVDGRYDCLGQEFTTFSTDAGVSTITFEAQSSEETLILTFLNSGTDDAAIDGISIKESLSNPTFTYSDVYDGQELLDLKDHNHLPLSISIDDFKNATEKIQSYSKDFSLPATKNNNKIFYNLYDVTVSVKDRVKTFNPLMQTKAKLSQDGIVIFEGFLKLTDIKFVDGQHEYNVHLYSEIISLASTLKDRKLKDLDFQELEHDYTSATIEDSWTGELPLLNNLSIDSFAYDGNIANLAQTAVLKYPFIDWTGSIQDTQGEINLTNLQQAYRPFIQCKYILDKIFDAAGFRYSSTFLNQDKFTKLFMDFNHGDDTGTSTENVDTKFRQEDLGNTTHWLTPSYTNINYDHSPITNSSAFWDTNTNRFTATNDNQNVKYISHFRFQNTNGIKTRNIKFRVLHTTLAGVETEYNVQEMKLGIMTSLTLAGGSGEMYVVNFGAGGIDCNIGDTIEFQAKTFTSNTSQVRMLLNSDGQWGYGLSVADFTVNNTGITAQSLLEIARGETGQWDFIKGLFNMFNLVAMPDDSDNKAFIIEPYDSIFISHSDSKTHDWTMKENAGQHTIKSLELIKTSYFTYMRDKDDYASNIYADAVATQDDKDYLYGSLDFDASGLTLLRGEQTTDTVIFAPTLIKPISDVNISHVTPAIYKGDKDGIAYSSYANLPRILYDCGKVSGNVAISSPFQNSSTERFDRKYSYLAFSTFSDLPTNNGTLDLNWTAVDLIGGGYGKVRNLFNEYWASYYDELYHVDTRIVTTELILTANDLKQYKFYDKIILKNKEYRINKINYKPNSASIVELILLP